MAAVRGGKCMREQKYQRESERKRDEERRFLLHYAGNLKARGETAVRGKQDSTAWDTSP